jgi:hypothetical protein
LIDYCQFTRFFIFSDIRFELESEYQLWLDLLKQRSHILQRPIVFEGPVLFRHPARLDAGFQSAHAVLTSGAQLLLFASTSAASAAVQLIQDAMSSSHSVLSIDTGADGVLEELLCFLRIHFILIANLFCSELIDVGDAWFQKVQELDMMPFLFVVQRTIDGATESLAQCVGTIIVAAFFVLMPRFDIFRYFQWDPMWVCTSGSLRCVIRVMSAPQCTNLSMCCIGCAPQRRPRSCT